MPVEVYSSIEYIMAYLPFSLSDDMIRANANLYSQLLGSRSMPFVPPFIQYRNSY